MQTFLKFFLDKQNATDRRVYSRTTTIIIEPAGSLYQLASTLQVDRSSVFLSNFHAAASFSASVWLFVSTRWRLCLGSGRTGHGRLSKGYHVNVRQYLRCFGLRCKNPYTALVKLIVAKESLAAFSFLF